MSAPGLVSSSLRQYGFVALTLMALLAGGAARAAEAMAPRFEREAIPDFRGFWAHGPLEELEPLAWQPGSTRHLNGALDRADVHVVFAGDPTNPNLKPWAAAIVKKISDEALALDAAGQVIITNNPQESCRPSGTPNALLLPAPMQVLQEPRQVTILHQRDHQVRRVHLYTEHSPNLKPTPYGESIGHYEGDTLVIDTIGMTDDTPLDMFGTPHSKELHVIERWRLVDGGNRLEIMIEIDDPVTFNHPFTTRMFYNRNLAADRIIEEICAENNRLPTTGNYTIPTAGPNEPRY